MTHVVGDSPHRRLEYTAYSLNRLLLHKVHLWAKILRFRPPISFFNTFDLFPYTTVIVNPHRAHLGGDEICGTKEAKVDICAEIETLGCHDFLLFWCRDIFLIYYSLSIVSKFHCAHLGGDGMIKYAGRKSCTMPLPDIRGRCINAKKIFCGISNSNMDKNTNIELYKMQRDYKRLRT